MSAKATESIREFKTFTAYLDSELINPLRYLKEAQAVNPRNSFTAIANRSQVNMLKTVVQLNKLGVHALLASDLCSCGLSARPKKLTSDRTASASTTLRMLGHLDYGTKDLVTLFVLADLEGGIPKNGQYGLVSTFGQPINIRWWCQICGEVCPAQKSENGWLPIDHQHEDELTRVEWFDPALSADDLEELVLDLEEELESLNN